MYQESLNWSRLISSTRVFRTRLINPPIHQKYFRCPLFFFFYFLLFSSHTFLWACGSSCEPRKCSFFVHSLVCQITHSFVNGFQPNLYQHLSHVCSNLLYYFQPEVSTGMYLRRVITLQLIVAITWTPGK